jgi:hypothetical protein
MFLELISLNELEFTDTIALVLLKVFASVDVLAHAHAL